MTTESDEKLLKSRTSKSKKMRQRLFLDAFAKSMGNITKACKEVGINRQTFYDWIQDPEFEEKTRIVVEEEVVDFMESKLYQLINGVAVQKQEGDSEVVYQLPPNTTAVIFGLKCKGKHRGWVERQEIVQVAPIDLAKLTYEELCDFKSGNLSEKQVRAIVFARSGVGSGDQTKAIANDGGAAEDNNTV